jgi:hypothetical protein
LSKLDIIITAWATGSSTTTITVSVIIHTTHVSSDEIYHSQ